MGRISLTVTGRGVVDPFWFRCRERARETCGRAGCVSLCPVPRKEVFQPHLPVRLPCYDLAPITGVTLGRACDGYGL